MSNVYLIKPLEKKSVVYHVEMYRDNPNGSMSWFNIDETFRWGQGFIDATNKCGLPAKSDKTAICDLYAGWGAELDDSCACFFEYSDDIGEEERQSIESAYEEGGLRWLEEGEHEWKEENGAIHVLAPFKVSLCKADGTVIEQDVELKSYW